MKPINFMRAISGEIKITLIYLAAGCLWIVTTGLVAGRMLAERIQVFEIAKGLLYVGLTALLLYGLLRRYIGALTSAHKRIHQLAYLDEGTGLPNTHYFWEKLQKTIEAEHPFLLLVLRISRFEDIQDVYGRKHSQALVFSVADRLQLLFGDDVFISRTENDTFSLIAKLGKGMRREGILQSLERVLKEPFALEEDEVMPAFHVGIARYPGDGSEGDLLVHCAYRSLSRAKEAGRMYIMDNSAGKMETARRRMYLGYELKKALARGQFTQHFQPKISVETGEVVGIEALIRWNHPVLGSISPAEFIPIAEENGDIVSIGRWMLSEACRQAKWLQQTQQCRVPVSVNVSAKQFWQNIAEDVEAALEEAGLAPEYLILELTESMMINPESAIRILSRLKSLGVKISIDDFGTGFSSLAYLKRLPIDEIKIDKSFIDEILAENRDRQIVRSMVAMAHHLNLTVVAEGVEKKEQLDCLRALGCDQVQGYYYSEPLDADRLALFLSNGNQTPVARICNC